MPDLLIELFSEEIPARMQAKAREDLKKLVTDGLVEAGLTYASAGALSTPRRLCLTIDGLTAQSQPVREERKGPKTDAPEKALEGFLRSTGLTLDQLEIRDDKKKAKSISRLSRSRDVRPPRSSPRFWKRRSATSLGRNRCAGARATCVGCARCIRSCASSPMRRGGSG